MVEQMNKIKFIKDNKNVVNNIRSTIKMTLDLNEEYDTDLDLVAENLILDLFFKEEKENKHLYSVFYNE